MILAAATKPKSGHYRRRPSLECGCAVGTFGRNAHAAEASADLSPELAALIEDVTLDNRGRLIRRLHSKLAASRELRAMLNINAKEAPRDVTQLSDAELIQQLADQAKELGIEIDLNYRFAKPKKEPDK
jgi:hypothetical protein